MTASADRARLLSWPTRDRHMLIADVLATGVAVALPWSTSATEILVWLWLIAAVPLLAASPATLWLACDHGYSGALLNALHSAAPL